LVVGQALAPGHQRYRRPPACPGTLEVMATRLGREVGELYEQPLADFVRARNALAARLKKAGRAAEGEEVKRIPKPTIVVWAINQVARSAPDDVSRFVDAVADLQRVHLAEAGRVSQARENERQARQRVLDRARDVLVGAGGAPSPTIVSRLSTTLLGAAAQPQLRSDLRSGRLQRELQPSGFELLEGAAKPPPLSAPGPRKAPDRPRRAPRSPTRPPTDAVPPRRPAQAAASAAYRKARREKEARREQEARARQAARVAEREARDRSRRAQRLERAAAAHDRAAAAAERGALKLRQRLDALEGQAAQRRQAADQARQEALRLRDDTEEGRSA
jgi:hypothetical protein